MGAREKTQKYLIPFCLLCINIIYLDLINNYKTNYRVLFLSILSFYLTI